MNVVDILARGKRTLLIEGNNLINLSNTLDDAFVNAVNEIYSTKGRIITSGVGKSGHIARKAASTFASTGTPSFFVDPTECMHGDFGMITKDDIMLLYSKSGETKELINIVEWLSRESINYIAITSEKKSTLSMHAKITLLINSKEEACPLKLAPTVSTTLSLALSDALATALMELRGFKEEDFAVFHPGGSLGKQLSTVSKIMHTENLPIVRPDDKLHKAIFSIMEHKLGLVIIAENNILRGLLVDGDIKRIVLNLKNNEELSSIEVKDVMNKKPITITEDTLIGEAIKIMEGKITNLIVVRNTDNGDIPVGVLHIHDILKFKAI